ncbi:MAG: hypothetical protein HPAVJP_5650 [Candidatus Hepatoplasma vulgare]|nr:MAG: hypothetical protein HPAVJP_5650 [Candidatus Hepatoplasma sp.]
MAIKNPDAKQLSLIQILTDYLITIDATLEGGINQEIINENNFTSLNQIKTLVETDTYNISANEASIGTLSNLNTTANADLVQSINELKDAINMINGKGTSSYPVGTIVIAPTAPQIGGWENLGEVLEGQAIIGGTSTYGSVMSHTHNVEYNGSADDYEHKYWDICDNMSSGNYSRGSSNNSGNLYVDIANRLQIISTGGKENIPYGIGMGLGLYVWKKNSK